MSEISRLALALHECDLGGRCKAKGEERQRHVNAYLKVAQQTVDRLAASWEPKEPPRDVSPWRRS